MKLKSGPIPKKTKKIYCVIHEAGRFLWEEVFVFEWKAALFSDDYRWEGRECGVYRKNLQLGYNEYGLGFIYVFEKEKDAEMFLQGGLAVYYELAHRTRHYLKLRINHETKK